MNLDKYAPYGNKVLVEIIKEKDIGHDSNTIKTVKLPKYHKETEGFSNVAKVLKVSNTLSEDYKEGDYVVFTYTSGFTIIQDGYKLYALLDHNWILAILKEKPLDK